MKYTENRTFPSYLPCRKKTSNYDRKAQKFIEFIFRRLLCYGDFFCHTYTNNNLFDFRGANHIFRIKSVETQSYKCQQNTLQFGLEKKKFCMQNTVNGLNINRKGGLRNVCVCVYVQIRRRLCDMQTKCMSNEMESLGFPFSWEIVIFYIFDRRCACRWKSRSLFTRKCLKNLHPIFQEFFTSFAIISISLLRWAMSSLLSSSTSNVICLAWS